MKFKSLIVKFYYKIRIGKQKLLAEHVIRTNGLPKSTKIINGEVRIMGDFQCGENCRFYNDVSIKAGNKIRIGRYTSVAGPNTDLINSIYPIQIGSFCSIARNVSIQEYNHDSSNFTTYYIRKNLMREKSQKEKKSKGPIVIGNDVWIGAHCVILSGAKIGDGAIIAANSVVTGEIPPYAIAGGTPARIIKFRFSREKIEHLLKTEWHSKINQSNYYEWADKLNRIK